jgi:hypothetical protein
MLGSATVASGLLPHSNKQSACGRPAGRLNLRCRGDLVDLLADDRIAFAGPGFETMAIDDLNATAMVADETGVLQRAGDNGDGRPSHAEHLRQEFVR